MKKNNLINLVMASILVMISITAGCATAPAGKKTSKNTPPPTTVVTVARASTSTTAHAAPPAVTNPAPTATNAPTPTMPPAPDLSSPPPLPSTNTTAQATTNNAAAPEECTEEGMSGGVPCLFENTTTDDLTVVVNSAANRHGKTFILRLEARTNRAFNLIPGEYTYSYIIGDDQAPRLAVGPITKTVNKKAGLYYDGAGNFHALFTIDNRYNK